MGVIEKNINAIRELCGKYRVKTLAVFGSVLTPRFNDSSDIDLLVDFDTTHHEEWDYVSNYFDLRSALERLFGRKVDLIEERGIRNPLSRQLIESQKLPIYG